MYVNKLELLAEKKVSDHYFGKNLFGFFYVFQSFMNHIYIDKCRYQLFL